MRHQRLFYAAVVFALGSWAPRATISQEPVVPGLKGCTSAAFDDTNQVLIENHCAYDVQAVWFFGNANRGSSRLATQQRAATGVTSTQIPELGSLRMFTCPVDYPIPRTSSGQVLTSPEREFVCGKKTGHHFDASSPRTFDYPVLTSGDCVIERGKLTFTSNGEARWSASIHTNQTMNRDIWHLAFNVVDANGNTLFNVPLGDSPEMRGSPSPVIPWGVIYGFDKDKFRAIDDVMVTRSSC